MAAPKLHDPQPEAPDPLPRAAGDKIKPRRLSWLVPDRVPRGCVVVIEGRKGTGKTCLLSALAADVTGGPRLLGGRRRALGSVHWYGPEESHDAITRPKLTAAGVDLARFFALGVGPDGRLSRRLSLPRDLWALQNTLALDGSRMLVLDPLSSAVDIGVSLLDEQGARSVLDPLALLADQLDCTVMLARHIRKQTGGPAIDQGLGGVGVGNAARTVLRCDRHPERSGFVLSWVAHLGAPVTSLAYDLIDAGDGAPKVRFRGDCDLDAESLAEGFGDQGDRDARGDARRLLARRIGDKWCPARDVLAEAKNAGVGERTLRTAKAELRVRSRRVQTGEVAHWEWGPPEEGWPKGL